MADTHSLIIVGAGPAGYAAAIYAARAGLSPLLVAGPQPGGQLMITTDVENYPGYASIMGPDLMAAMQHQAELMGTQILRDEITSIRTDSQPFQLVTDANGTLQCKALIFATGAQARWLGVEGEDTFKGYGVSACATCDGFFFREKVVAVIGGGNTAAEEALYLTKHADTVYLIHRRDSMRAEKILQDRLLAHPKIRPLWHRTLLRVSGTMKPLRAVTEITLADAATGMPAETLPVDGVFVAIGHDPATALLAGQVESDRDGYIITTPNGTATSVPGLFAAGDVCDPVYRQAVTAAGMGCMAALDAGRWLSD